MFIDTKYWPCNQSTEMVKGSPCDQPQVSTAERCFTASVAGETSIRAEWEDDSNHRDNIYLFCYWTVEQSYLTSRAINNKHETQQFILRVMDLYRTQLLEEMKELKLQKHHNKQRFSYSNYYNLLSFVLATFVSVPVGFLRWTRWTISPRSSSNTVPTTRRAMKP